MSHLGAKPTPQTIAGLTRRLAFGEFLAQAFASFRADKVRATTMAHSTMAHYTMAH